MLLHWLSKAAIIGSKNRHIDKRKSKHDNLAKYIGMLIGRKKVISSEMRSIFSYKFFDELVNLNSAIKA